MPMETASQYLLFKWKGKHWPAKALEREKSNSKEKKIEVEILGDGSRVWIQEQKTRPMTLKRIEHITAHMSKSAYKTQDPIKELTYRKALRLGLDISKQIPMSSLQGCPGTAKTPHDQPATTEGTRDIRDMNVRTSEADKHIRHGQHCEGLEDNSPSQIQTSPKIVRKVRCSLRTRTSQTQRSSSSKSLMEEAGPVLKSEAIPCSTGNVDVITLSSETSSELTLSPPQFFPLIQLPGGDVPVDTQEDDEDEEELPSFCLQEDKQAVTKGACVWCKVKGFSYWPAMINRVYPKEKRASVLFIDENSFPKIKIQNGIKVPIRNLKPFDGEETAELVDRARDRYGIAIDHCLELIRDYKIRLGCGSFSGSLVEYIADDISIPTRRLYKSASADMSSPIKAILSEENISAVDHQNIDSPSTQEVLCPDQEVHSPDEELCRTKRLLPDRSWAARKRKNEKLVQFIVKVRGLEEHLQAVISENVSSKWLRAYRKNSRTVVKIYFEDEQQLDLVYNYLKEVLEKTSPRFSELDKIHFILDVLLPEAIIHGISVVDGISLKKAEDMYMQGPCFSEREREEFDLMILKQKKKRHSKNKVLE